MNLRGIPIAGLLLTLVACSGDDDPDASSSTTEVSTTVAVSTTTERTQTTSTTAPTTEPTTTSTIPATVPLTTETTAPVVAVDDWRVVIETLGRRSQALYAEPDVLRISEVCAGESPCSDQLNVQLSDLATKGWHVTGDDPYTVLDAHVEGFDGDTLETSLLVTVLAVVQRPSSAGRIVDSAGAVVAELEVETTEGMNTEGRTILARIGPDDDPWRIVSQERVREVPA